MPGSMAKPPPPSQRRDSEAKYEDLAHTEKLAAKLRENLKRRKAASVKSND